MDHADAMLLETYTGTDRVTLPEAGIAPDGVALESGGAFVSAASVGTRVSNARPVRAGKKRRHRPSTGKQLANAIRVLRADADRACSLAALGDMSTALVDDLFEVCRKLKRVKRAKRPPAWSDLLPDEVLVRLFGFLESSDAGRLQLCCRRFRDLVAHENSLWRIYFDRKIGGTCEAPHDWLEASHPAAAGPFWRWMLKAHSARFDPSRGCCGLGTWTTTDDDDVCVYAGEWSMGKMTGRGCMVLRGYWNYVGDFVDGLASGKGICRWSDGSVYDGEWQYDERCGRGRDRLASGDTYEGQLRDGEWDGIGTWRSADGSRTYTGGWSEGMRHGRGRSVDADGTTYEGEWKDDQRHGRGIALYPAHASPSSALSHDGFWCEGKRRGHGTTAFRDGRTLVARWKNDCLIVSVFNRSMWHVLSFEGRTYAGPLRLGMWSGTVRLEYANGDALTGDWQGCGIEPATFRLVRVLSFDCSARCPCPELAGRRIAGGGWKIVRASPEPLYCPNEQPERDAFLAYARAGHIGWAHAWPDVASLL